MKLCPYIALSASRTPTHFYSAAFSVLSPPRTPTFDPAALIPYSVCPGLEVDPKPGIYRLLETGQVRQ